MSDMWGKTESKGVRAVVMGDSHNSLRVPAARAETPQEWRDVWAYYWGQVSHLSAINGHCPILHSGDVNDRWDLSAEEINFFLDVMPTVYAVPGQHDLPHHLLSEIERSAYWTMVKAGRVRTIYDPTKPTMTGIYLQYAGLYVEGFPWGVPVTDRGVMHHYQTAGALNIAVIHRYVWTHWHSHPDARPGDRVDKVADDLPIYNAAVIGDNHKGFVYSRSSPTHIDIMVNGTFIRRKADEQSYSPMVGLLRSDGVIVPHFLNTSKDKFRSETEKAPKNIDLDSQEFLEELKSLRDKPLNYKEAVLRALDDKKTKEAVRLYVISALEDKG